MLIAHARLRARVAVLTIVSFLTGPVAPLFARQAPTTTQAPAKPATATPAPAKPAAATPAAAKPATPTAAKAAPAPVPADGGWPRAYTTASGATMVIYQPQVAAWEEQKRLTAYSAVSYTSKGATKPTLGTIKLESDTSVALDERLVNFSQLMVTESNFPTLDRDRLRVVVSEITAAIPLDDRVIGLDRVLANIDTSQVIPKNVDGVKADPPPIFFSQTPAILVNLDGEPIWAPIKQNDLQSAVNTNWDLFQHVPTKTFYLRNEKAWLKATDLNGPWTSTTDLPDSFEKLPDDDPNWKEIKDNLPGWRSKTGQAPKVFVSLVPAELILVTGGKPVYATITGVPKLLWVSNTESDVFRMGATGAVYFLVSGRWFSAPDFTGPWTFATPNLPDDFKKIPLEHARSRVLASVPGTTQAAEAVLLASIPQTARVSKTLQAPMIDVSGRSGRVPADRDDDGAARGQHGQGRLQGRGSVLPLLPGRLVHVDDAERPVVGHRQRAEGDLFDSGQLVVLPRHLRRRPGVEQRRSGFRDGHGVHRRDDRIRLRNVGHGVLLPAVYGFYGGYPYYYPRYPSYGYHASYNPWTGAYTRGVSAYGPYGGAGAAQRYNPRTGTYSRGAVAYGPGGSRGVAQAYNPRTGAYGQTRQGSNVYGNWGSTQVQRGDQWASTSHVTNNRTGTTTRTASGSGGGSAVTRTGGAGGNSGAVKTGSGDMYAGRDGNVYKNTGDGWQKSDGNGNWNNVQPPTDAQKQQAQDRASQAGDRGTQAGTQSSGRAAGWDSSTAGQVQRDSAARAEGTQRTTDQGRVQSGSSTRSGSYRAGGGASRGGGGGGRRR